MNIALWGLAAELPAAGEGPRPGPRKLEPVDLTRIHHKFEFREVVVQSSLFADIKPSVDGNALKTMEADQESVSVSKQSDEQNMASSPSPFGEPPATANSSVNEHTASAPSETHPEEGEEGENEGRISSPASPAPDPARVSLIKCCEWLEGKLSFPPSNEDGEISEIRTAFIEFLSDNSIETLFVYEDRKAGNATPSFVAKEIPTDGQVFFRIIVCEKKRVCYFAS